jgi:hypothetical protein
MLHKLLNPEGYMTAKSIVTQEAKWGEKMIEVKVRFWTNNIAEEKGKIRPRHAWASGVVRIDANRAHGIRPTKPIPFHSLMDLSAVIEKVLISHGITLHAPRKMQKYVAL